MSDENISENELLEKRTMFEWVKIDAPKIDGFFKAQYEIEKSKLHRELDFKFDDEEKLSFLDEKRKELREFMVGQEVHVFCSWGDSKIDVDEENVDFIGEFAQQFPDIVSILKFPAVLADANGMDFPPDYFQKLNQVIEGLNNPMQDIDEKQVHELLEIGLENTYKQKDRDWNVLQGVSKMLRKGNTVGYAQAMLSEIYYKRKQFNYVCNLYNNTEHKMINGNTEEVSKSKLHWGKSKTDLIRLLIALHDVKAIKNEDGEALNQQQIMNEFSRFLNMDLSGYERDLSNGFDKSEDANLTFFNKLKEAIRKRWDKKNS